LPRTSALAPTGIRTAGSSVAASGVGSSSAVAWLFNFRRFVSRYERKVELFRAFVLFDCALVALRRF